jgi:putative transposase
MLDRGLGGAMGILLDTTSHHYDCGIIAHTIMPDHLHVIACVLREGGDVLSFFKEFKRGAALAADRRGLHGLWQRDFWDRHTRNDHDLKRCVTYVLWNPVEEGLCGEPRDWPHTSFRGWPWSLVEREHEAEEDAGG